MSDGTAACETMALEAKAKAKANANERGAVKE